MCFYHSYIKVIQKHEIIFTSHIFDDCKTQLFRHHVGQMFVCLYTLSYTKDKISATQLLTQTITLTEKYNLT